MVRAGLDGAGKQRWRCGVKAREAHARNRATNSHIERQRRWRASDLGAEERERHIYRRHKTRLTARIDRSRAEIANLEGQLTHA